jgi:hypothetical protein
MRIIYISHIYIDICYLFHLINSPKRHRFQFCIGLCLGLKKTLKHAQNTKNRHKFFLKSFKICHNRDLKKAQKTKIGPKGPLPDMWIGDSNHNKHTDTISNWIIPMRIPKSDNHILRMWIWPITASASASACTTLIYIRDEMRGMKICFLKIFCGRIYLLFFFNQK